MFAWQMERMQNIAEKYNWTKFVSQQPQYNLIYREEDGKFCRSAGIAKWPC